ncbi:MAG: RNA 2',3'-cyclic phosphodiesterase [Dongiaceae bacterium]
MRLFVALALPDNIRWQLRLICGGLAGAGRWVPPENLHITLRFLGEVDGRDTDYVDAALAGIRAPRFPLRLKGVGAFTSGQRVKAVYAGIEKQPALQHLRDKVESAVVRAGLPPEGQKYTPHVTLSRPKEAPLGKLQHYLAEHSLFKTEPFEVTHFTLYSSVMGSEQAVYTALRSYALSTPASQSAAIVAAEKRDAL